MDTTGGGGAELAQEFLPLKALAHVLTALLVSELGLAAARLLLPQLNRGDTPFQASIDLRPVVAFSRVVLGTTVVLFLIWFRRARINAERCGWRQRRARAWVFWGWVIPIASLWVPFQLMGDIWRAGLPPSQRNKVAWLPVVWWASWLLSQIRTATPSGLAAYGLRFPTTWPSLSLFAVAGMTLIAIVQIVSSRPVGTLEVQRETPVVDLASARS